MSKALLPPGAIRAPEGTRLMKIGGEEEGRRLIRESGERGTLQKGGGPLMDIGADGNDVIDVDATTVEVKPVPLERQPLSRARRRVLLNGVWSAFELSLEGKPLRLDGIKAIDWTEGQDD